jgi:transcription initiation factor IIE alpha subunit
MGKPLLGEILLENGEISDEQMNKALEVQKNEGGLIGIILVTMGAITEQTLVKYLAIQAERVAAGD